jgi:hypothetical protein
MVAFVAAGSSDEQEISNGLTSNDQSTLKA